MGGVQNRNGLGRNTTQRHNQGRIVVGGSVVGLVVVLVVATARVFRAMWSTHNIRKGQMASHCSKIEHMTHIRQIMTQFV